MNLLKLTVNQWLREFGETNSLIKGIAFLITWVILWLPLAIPIAKRLKWHPSQPLTSQQKIPLLLSLYLIAPLIVWYAGKFEGDSFRDYGISWNSNFLISLLVGFCLAIITIILIFSLQSIVGWLQWHRENIGKLLPIFLPLLGLAIGVGFIEELIFRGFFWVELKQDYSIWQTGIISSGIFALSHLIWEPKEAINSLPGLWLMGIILIIARIVNNNSLALAWGLHSGWIWILSSLGETELISYTGKASIWLTGSQKQPLSGLAGILCLLITGIILSLLSILK